MKRFLLITSLTIISQLCFTSRLFGCWDFSFCNKEIQGNPTAVVFDWDDTFLPSSQINTEVNKNWRKVIEEFSKEHFDKLQELDERVASLIELVEEDADVFLVSNAIYIWIYVSSERLLPKTYDILRRLMTQSRCLSAQEFYKDAHKSSNLATMHLWKEYTFKRTFSKKYETVISIGDGDHEKKALFKLNFNADKIKWRKSIQTISLGSYDKNTAIESLIEQIDFLVREWRKIFNWKNDLDSYLELDKEGIFHLYPREYGIDINR